MAATSLSVGDVAIIGVDTEDNGNPLRDSLTFILLAPIGSGTQIFFTDRTWNGSAFAAAGGGDSTYTYTAGSDLPAGTVIRITQADLTSAGINLSDVAETIYVYQGAVNAPATFLHAVDIGDSNTTFNGSLVNTGLVSGTSAVAIDWDNARFGTRLWNINKEDLFLQINNTNDWNTSDNSPQPTTLAAEPDTTAPDSVIYVAGAGAERALIQLHLDGTYNSGSVAYAIHHAFQNDSSLDHPSDITFDPVNDKFFFVDSDIFGANRIVQGSISQVLANPGAPIVLTTLWQAAVPGVDNGARSISVDTVNQKIYFDAGTTFNRINYDTASQTATQLANLGIDHYITQMSINYTSNTVYLASSQIVVGWGADVIFQNQVYTAIGLTGSNASLTFSPITFTQNDDTVTGEGVSLGSLHWPVERGNIRGIDVDESTGLVYIVTGTAILDNDGNGSTTYYGGVWTYNPVGGAITNLFTQNGSTGPVGILYYIDVDPITGRYYVLDETGTNASVEDSSVWTGTLGTVGMPTLVANLGNINGLGGQGLEIQHAPTLTGTGATPGVTEASSAPSSGETSRVSLFTGIAASDLDITLGVVGDESDDGDQLRGAIVRVSGNFQQGATHQDILTINNAQSGTIAGSGIAFSYSSTTGTMTLSGKATVAEYKAAIELAQFSTSGDNITNYGSAGTRTVSASVFDGLLYSSEVHATVTVTGINDAPVNTPGGAATAVEDTTGTTGTTPPVNAITGISVFDVDANPATQDIVVTLSVANGTLTIRTDVAGGLAAGEVTGNGTATLTLTGTQNQINATLAAVNGSAQANGLVYTPTANYNGADTLTIVTNDAGFNGTDPLLTGTPTSEQDSDTKTINITNVNDAPTVSGDGTEGATTILEDTPSAAGQTITSLFAGQFADALDAQQTGGNPTGSVANTLAGIAVVANGSSVSTGQWQYFNGASWVDVGAATTAAGKMFTAATSLRFNPVQDFNGAAPTLTVHLIDSSGAAITNASAVDLSGVGATGGATRFSTATVVLSQDITPVNDAPTSTNLSGDSVTWTEGGAAVKLDLSANAGLADVDSADFGTGTLTVAISAGKVAAEDQLGVVSDADVTVGAGTVTVGGNVIATFAGGGAGGGDLVFTLNSFATPASVAQLLQTITFSNTGGESPTDGDRTITWTLVDGDGTANGGVDTLSVGTTVDVDPVNDAPAGANKTVVLLEDTTYAFSAADFGFSDVDGNAISAVRFTTVPITGTLMLDADGAGAGAAVAVTAGQVVATTYMDGRLYYAPPLNGNGAGMGSFTFQVVDDGGTADGGVDTDQSANTVTFDVTAVNDAPVVTLPATYGATEQVPLDLKGSMTVADVDAGSGTITATLSVSAGILNVVAGDSGAVVQSGNGTGTVVLTGSQTQVNALLTSGSSVVTFTANSDTPPASATITLSVADGGATGGPEETGNDTATINIAAVNDAPAGTDNNTISVSEDDPYTFTAADFGFTDSDGHAFAGIVITTLATDGLLLLDGVTNVTLGQFISAADLAGNRLTFMPSPDESGNDYASFTFQVRDDGGVLNGGVDTDQSANTITIDVIPDNLLPVVDLDGSTGSFDYATSFTEDSATPIAIGTGIGVSDLDAGSTVASAVVTLTDALSGETLSLAGALPGGILSALNPAGTVLTLSGGSGLHADYAAALAQVRFFSTHQNPAGNGATPTRTITTVVNDGISDSAAATTTVTMTSLNDAPTGGAAISGTAAEDQVLTAVSTLADADGLGTLHYQWQHDVGSGFVNVGADQSTYTLGDADIGGVVRVIISYTDGGGTAESASSAATGAIAAVNDPHTGGVSITGTATEDQVLTADTSTLADADGLGTLHFQWERDTGSGFGSVGTDQATYTLGDADVGGVVRVVVTYTDDQGFAESATSTATAAIAGVNDPHTGGAAITGTATENQVLTAVSTLADVDGLGTLHYQWQHDVGSGFVNVGADQATYTLGDADVGGIVRVIISYTDGQGFAESATSSATAAVANVNDGPTGGVSITGTTTEDQVLTADTSTLADDDGLGTLHYQWQRNTGSGFVNVGADQATYTLGDADVGGVVRVVVSYTDEQGTAEATTSTATGSIAAVNDPHTGGASITGSATEDQVLTAVSTLADVDGLGTLHYQWQHDVGSGFVNVGADQATYTLGDADVGGVVRVVISYTDGQGFAESATSSSTAAVTNVNDAPTGGVSITGTTTEDEVLTADTSTLADDDGLGTLHYQWQRDTGSGFVNVGADQATYTLGEADVGGVVRVVVSYTDEQGTAEATTSTPTGSIAAVNDPHTGGVSITGTATEDQMLTADTSTLVDADGLGTLHYQWQRDTGSGFGNVGSDQATYTLGDADVGAAIRVVVSYTDGQGFAESATSDATGAVTNVNDLPTGSVTITGIPTQGRTLTASNTLADLDGMGTVTYQWQADGIDIGGATGTTLVLGAAEVGKAITAVAKYTDLQGTAEEVPSSPTALVSADGDPPVVVSFTPEDNDGSASLGTNIVFTFNETIVAGSGDIVLKTSSGAIVETFSVGSSPNLVFGATTLTIDPSSNLSPGVGYRVEFAPGTVLDLAGNVFAGTPDYNFATPSLPINGTSMNDFLVGTEGDDIINGGLGADRMFGRLGDDTYYVDNFGDVVVEQADGGEDHVIVVFPYLPWSTYVLGANVENLTLGNSPVAWLPYPLNGTGNALDNVLVGNNSANKLTGLGGADTLVGGLGADRFAYQSASDTGTIAGTWDVIQDFNRLQGDKIDLQAIDANTSAAGNQAFVFIGTAAFGADATGRLRFDAGAHMLYGSTDADADAEFAIELVGVASLVSSDFLL